jgi:hypothetical protein
MRYPRDVRWKSESVFRYIRRKALRFSALRLLAHPAAAARPIHAILNGRRVKVLGSLGFEETPVGVPEFDEAAAILSGIVIKPHTQPINREQMSRTSATFREIESAIGEAHGYATSISHRGLRRYSQGKLTVIDFGEFRIVYRDWEGDS